MWKGTYFLVSRKKNVLFTSVSELEKSKGVFRKVRRKVLKQWERGNEQASLKRSEWVT